MNKFTIIFHKLLWNFREHGILNLLHKASIILWRASFLSAEHVFFLDCTQLAGGEFYLPRNLKVQRYGKKEDLPKDILDKLKFQIQKKGMGEEIVEHYLKNLFTLFRDGGVMWVAIMENELAGYFWTLFDKDNYAPYFQQFPLSSGEAVYLAGLIFPNYRGLGIFASMLRYVAFQVKEDGIQSIFTRVKVWNKASARALVKAGFNIIGTQRQINVFGRCIIIWSKGTAGE